MLAASDAAPQHARAPRPLPLFLDMVRRVAADDPELAARALAGVRRYGEAARDGADARAPLVRLGPLGARIAGTSGPPVVLVPSLINPASIMDLDADRSLLRWLGRSGVRAHLLDWGKPGIAERDRDLAAHVTDRLLPALVTFGEPVHLVGYCLGGVLATAAAALHPVRSLSLIAAPWHFDGYDPAARTALATLWQANVEAAHRLGVLPMEMLQAAFWGLDPDRAVRKFAALADRAPDDPVLTGFARLEDWANGGAPLTLAAGRDLFETLIGADATGAGRWRVGGQLIDPAAIPCRARQWTALEDRIAPAATAAKAIPSSACPAGHVGMVVGSRAESHCWTPLLQWIAAD